MLALMRVFFIHMYIFQMHFQRIFRAVHLSANITNEYAAFPFRVTTLSRMSSEAVAIRKLLVTTEAYPGLVFGRHMGRQMMRIPIGELANVAEIRPLVMIRRLMLNKCIVRFKSIETNVALHSIYIVLFIMLLQIVNLDHLPAMHTSPFIIVPQMRIEFVNAKKTLVTLMTLQTGRYLCVTEFPLQLVPSLHRVLLRSPLLKRFEDLIHVRDIASHVFRVRFELLRISVENYVRYFGIIFHF